MSAPEQVWITYWKCPNGHHAVDCVWVGEESGTKEIEEGISHEFNVRAACGEISPRCGHCGSTVKVFHHTKTDLSRDEADMLVMKEHAKRDREWKATVHGN